MGRALPHDTHRPQGPAIRFVGDTTITGKNQVSIPVKGMQALGWQRGDRLLVEVAHDDLLILLRRPARWADAFAGKLGHVFGSHEDTLAYLEAARESWDED
jgi:bifunctional DNA-binding transcriptional regulator/antitoxin component of YhaV-PrlF toxin-antitoxin module